MKARTAIMALLLLPAAAMAQEDRLDPAAVEIMQKAANFLASQPKMAFSWFFTYDVVLDGREKITFLRSGDTMLERGVGFVTHSERGDGRRDHYYDGVTFSVSAPDDGYYASAPFDGDYDTLLEIVKARTGTVVPLWGMLSAKLPEQILDGVESAAYVGETRIAGIPAHHLAFSEYDLDWQIWISMDETAPLPLMIVATEPFTQAWPQYILYMNDWNLSPEAAEGAYTLVPDQDAIPVSFSSLAPPDAEDEAEGSDVPMDGETAK